MISYCFSSITRHRFPRICELFVPKDFSRIFDVVWKFYSEKTITESKCLFGRHDDRQWPYVNRLLSILKCLKRSFGERWISFGKHKMSFETKIISFGKHKMSFETQIISFGKHWCMFFETRLMPCGYDKMSFETQVISFGKHKIYFETQLISIGKHEMSFETSQLLLTEWNASINTWIF